MTGRHKLIERLMAEFFQEPEEPIPDCEWSGIIVAGVKITNPEAIKKFTRRQLEKRVPDVETLKTCEDFAHLKAKCCDSCHSKYEIYEMNVVPLPEGGYAWVCCALDRALRPELHAERNRRFAKTKIGKMWNKLGEDMKTGAKPKIRG